MEWVGAVRVELLGNVRVVTSTGVVEGARLAPRRVRLALAVLALERGRDVDRHELAEVVWPIDLPATWASALRTVLSQVGEVLGEAGLPAEALRAEQGRVRLVLPAGSTTDVDACLALVETAERSLTDGEHEVAAAAAAEVRELLAGRLLVGEDGAYVDGWRQRLTAAGQRAAAVLCSALVATGRPLAAAAVADEAVAAEPFDEDAHRRLMSAHAAAGDRASALRAYTRCRLLFAEELGVDPAPETERLYLQLLMWERHDTAPAPARSHEPTVVPLLLGVRDLPLTGRVEELGALRRWWADVAAGAGGMAAISGEAGIGKTRLAAELAAEALDAGATVLHGRCDEHAAEVFQPFVEAARGWGAGHPDASLAAWLTGLDDAGPRDRGDERTGVFDALVTWLLALATEEPVLLVIDDLHWASPSTLVAIDRVLAGVRDARVGLVTTYRATSPATPDPVVIRAGELARTGRLRRVHLTGLDRPAVGTLLEHLVDAPLAEGDDRVAEMLATATGGNAFLVREATRHLLSTGALRLDSGMWHVDPAIDRALLSPAIRDVVSARLAALGDEHADGLTVAAVVGPTFDAAVVTACVGASAAATLDAAEALGLIEPVRDSHLRFRFVHDLVRSVLLDRVTAARRALLHQSVGSALEARDAPAAELAHHFVEAAGLGDTGRALRWTLTAADTAVAGLAYEDAQVPLRRLLELDLSPSDRARTLLALGDAEVRAGDSTGLTWAEAAEAARRAGDGELFARAALGRVASTPERSSWFAAECRSMLQEALAGLPAGAVELRVWVLGELALVTPWQEGRHDLGKEAMAIAEGEGSGRVMAAARRANLVARWSPADTADRLAFGESLLAADGVDRYVRAELGYESLGDLLQLGQRVEFDARLDALEADEVVGSSRRLHWQGRAWRAGMAIADGRLVDGERLGAAAIGLWPEGDGDALVSFGEQLAAIRLLQGRADEAAALLQEGWRRYPEVRGFAAAVAFASAEAGDAAVVEDTLAVVVDDDFAGLARDSSFTLGAACAAEAIRFVGDAGLAAGLYELLGPAAGLLIAIGGPAVYWGPVDHALGVLAETAGDSEAAAGHLRRAVSLATQVGTPPWEARAQVVLAGLPGDVRAPGERQGKVAAAGPTARALGLGSVARACAALLSADGSEPGSSTRRASAR